MEPRSIRRRDILTAGLACSQLAGDIEERIASSQEAE
jgi:hypothetical protein